MSIITESGVYTEELCLASKKYLSRLLVDQRGIDPRFITWNLLLREKSALDAFIETGEENLEQLGQARTAWNQLLKENNLKGAGGVIQAKLADIETKYLPERLKPYYSKVKKQEELKHKKRALLASVILLTLIVAFPFLLPLLGGGAAILTFVGLISSVVASAFLSYISAAFFAEEIPRQEWFAEYHQEKNKWKEKIAAIKATTEIEIIEEETEKTIANETPILPDKKPAKPLPTDATTQTPDDMDHPSTELPNNKFQFFITVDTNNKSPKIPKETSL